MTADLVQTKEVCPEKCCVGVMSLAFVPDPAESVSFVRPMFEVRSDPTGPASGLAATDLDEVGMRVTAVEYARDDRIFL